MKKRTAFKKENLEIIKRDYKGNRIFHFKGDPDKGLKAYKQKFEGFGKFEKFENSIEGFGKAIDKCLKKCKNKKKLV